MSTTQTTAPQLPVWCFQPDEDSPGLYLQCESGEQREAVMRALGWTPEKERTERALCDLAALDRDLL